MSESVIFTKRAASKVWDLIKEEGNLQLKLRAFVTGGGCSGLQYGFTFAEEVNEGDTVVTQCVTDQEGDKVNIALLIDTLSLQYLSGAEIDYKEDIEGEQFIIRNPNAKTTCGCGSSFTAE